MFLRREFLRGLAVAIATPCLPKVPFAEAPVRVAPVRAESFYDGLFPARRAYLSINGKRLVEHGSKSVRFKPAKVDGAALLLELEEPVFWDATESGFVDSIEIVDEDDEMLCTVGIAWRGWNLGPAAITAGSVVQIPETGIRIEVG